MTRPDPWRRSTVILAAMAATLSIALAEAPSWGADTPAVPSSNAGTNQAVFESERSYQGRGGEIRFTVAGDVKTQPDLLACLRWKSSGSSCDPNLPVRRVKETQEPPGVTYAFTIPPNFRDAPESTDRLLFGTVPLAELKIAASSASAPQWSVVRDVGVTSRLGAACMAILAVLIAGAVLYSFAIYLDVPGPKIPSCSKNPGAFLLHGLRGFSVPLRIISSAEGWASLSQLQIILWTFVVGAGAVYVMSLTFSLIAISSGTLALLGIAGAATVLSEVKNNQQSQPAETLLPPGAPTILAVEQQSETELLLSWGPPNGVVAPVSYLVEYEDPATAGVWRTASRALKATRLRIVGLTPGKAYNLRVFASNAAGTGPEAAKSAATASGALPAPSVTGLQAFGSGTSRSVSLKWNAVAGETYELQKRAHDSDMNWTPVKLDKAGAASATVPNLAPGTAYDFRVCTAASSGAWSTVVTFRTDARRTPKWSDIVTDTDRPAEIDVTRVQMLFFTVISAFFVAFNIVDTGTIPAIDPTYVTLMGISNGVYVTAKFVRPY